MESLTLQIAQAKILSICYGLGVRFIETADSAEQVLFYWTDVIGFA